MFKQQNEKSSLKEVETIIGPSVKVKGNFNGKGNIIVEGILEGNLKTAGDVLIGKNAKITANIEANEGKISGEVFGNIKIKKYLEISSTARITGNVDCLSISIEKGAILNGKCSMGDNGGNEKEEK